MNVFLWLLQGLLALHTLMGAIWKLANSEQAVPSLSMIPHWAWIGICLVEVVCVVGLVLPGINKRFAKAAPIAAGVIGFEMVVFSAVHIASGEPNFSPVIYWMVVAAICAFIAYGRLVLKRS